jgi:predicted nucleic acid-binding protein
LATAPAGQAWIVDASVALKWFMPPEREPDGRLAREMVGVLPMRTTTLAVYEVGNVLTVHSGWQASDIADALNVLRRTCGEPIGLEPQDELRAAELAAEHDLTFYDASYAALAERTRRRLISADLALLRSRLAVDVQAAALAGDRRST